MLSLNKYHISSLNLSTMRRGELHPLFCHTVTTFVSNNQIFDLKANSLLPRTQWSVISANRPRLQPIPFVIWSHFLPLCFVYLYVFCILIGTELGTWERRSSWSKIGIESETQDWQPDLETQGTQGLSESKVKSKMEKVTDYNRNFYWEQTKRVHGFLWQIKTGSSSICAPSQLQIFVNGARGDFFVVCSFWHFDSNCLRT